MRHFRFRPSPAMVVACIALFIAVGGTALASVIITTNSEVAKNTISGHAPPSGDHANIIKDSITGADIKESTLGPVPALAAPEALHQVGASGQPPFQNGWKNYGFSSAPAAFYKDREGVVHLQGTITGATTTPSSVFSLPPGYRPAVTQEFAALTVDSGPTRVINQLEVQSGGDVVLYDPVGIWASLSGITFRAGH
jgi:hypothetical protein